MEQHVRDNVVTGATVALIVLRWLWLPVMLATVGALLALVADWTPQAGPNLFLAPVIVLVAPGYLLAESVAAFGVFGAGSVLPVVLGTAIIYGLTGLLLRWLWHEYRR